MATKHLDPTYQIETWGQELNSQVIMFHHAIGERMGLSATEYKAADILRRFGPMTAGELAQQTGLTTGAVTGLVDRLERGGFVRRDHDKSDRRRVIITPIVKGRFDEVRDLSSPVAEAISHLLSQYGPREAAAIADFAIKSAELLKEETMRLRRNPHPSRRSA